MVCVPHDDDAMLGVVKRIAAEIEQVRHSICPDVRSTASIGAVLWEPGETVDAFLARADNDLHTAKVRAHTMAARIDPVHGESRGLG